MQWSKNNNTAGGCGEDWATFLGWWMKGIERFISIVENLSSRLPTFKTRLAMPWND
jgi:hypothetical protein